MVCDVDKKEIGERIRKARLACGYTSADALADEVPKIPGKKPTITRQTVNNWENGAVAPPLDKITYLAQLFARRGKPEYGEEWILFGDTQLIHKYLLENVSPEEAKLLMAYRRSSAEGRAIFLFHAEAIPEKYPEKSKVRQLRSVNKPEPKE